MMTWQALLEADAAGWPTLLSTNEERSLSHVLTRLQSTSHSLSRDPPHPLPPPLTPPASHLHSQERNVKFYGQLGFEVVKDVEGVAPGKVVQMEGGCEYPVWVMLRRPQRPPRPA